jgi:hypothetical protein
MPTRIRQASAALMSAASPTGRRPTLFDSRPKTSNEVAAARKYPTDTNPRWALVIPSSAR